MRLDDAWEPIWSKTNGVEDKVQIPIQLKYFTTVSFLLLWRIQQAKWNTASTGTYEINGNDYIETHQYSTEQNWIGSTYWQKYEIKGDTLYFTLFTKVTNSKGEDVTAQYPVPIQISLT